MTPYVPNQQVSENDGLILEWIGKSLKVERTNKSITISQLCHDLGISRTTYHQIEAGKVYFNFKILLKIMKYLEVPLSAFEFKPNKNKLRTIDNQAVITEIETQWEYHLMTRAIFDSQFPNRIEYSSAPFYEDHGINIHVKILNTKSDAFKRSSKGIARWLNQNYVIRLYGIIDSTGILKDDKVKDLDVIKLLKLLRNNVGAHCTGRKVSDRHKLAKATKLINSLFNRNISVQKVRTYTLSVDSVLLPFKNQLIELIKNYPLMHTKP